MYYENLLPLSEQDRHVMDFQNWGFLGMCFLSRLRA